MQRETNISAAVPVKPARPRAMALDWLRAPSIAQPLAVFGLSRLLFLALTYVGVILFNNALHSPTHPSFLHQLLPAWNNRWDTAWYIEIAQRGYAWRKAVGTAPTAFFPLYPLLVRAGVVVTHRSYFSVALAVSNLSFLGALLYLWRLTAQEIDSATAFRTILYISVFPTALFYFAGYTESLFLFTTVASFYYLRNGRWLVAGAFGALAAATRVTGVLLVLPIAYEYLTSIQFDVRQIGWRGVLGSVLPVSGLAAFALYLQVTVHDALAFSHDQAAWQKISTWRLWAGFLESLRQMFVVQPWASFFEVHNLINVGLGGGFLVASFFVFRRLPRSYGLYLLAFWVVTLSEPAMAGGYPVPLISLSRYILALFPVFMYLGYLGRRQQVHDTILVGSTALLAVLTVQFINGGWVI